jgi:hypothetical protein
MPNFGVFCPHYVGLALLVLFPLAGGALGSTCDAQKETFARLSKQIVFQENADPNAAAGGYPELAGPVTARLHKLIEEQVLDQLNADRFPQPSDIIHRIRCIQSGVPEYARCREEGCDPVAFEVRLGSELGLAIAFDIFRGGINAPDLRPYLEVFQNGELGWRAVGSIGSDFTGHTLTIRRLQPGKPGQFWFLLWGTSIGMGNAPLHLAVAAYDGESLNEIWAADLKAGPSVDDISGGRVTLSGEETNSKGRAQDFIETYRVVPEGLELLSHHITKIYRRTSMTAEPGEVISNLM